MLFCRKPPKKDIKRRKALLFSKAFKFLAEWTGLEPATPCVTGMYSNQLNYHSVFGSANIRSFLYYANGFEKKLFYCGVITLFRCYRL